MAFVLWLYYVASLDLVPLLKDYTVTPEMAVNCINVTIVPNGLVTQDVRSVSFSISKTNISSGIIVDQTPLKYIIHDSDSKFGA